MNANLDSVNIPPNAIELEEAVIGALIINPECIEKLSELRPDHFYSKSLSLIFEACQFLAQQDGLDFGTLVQRLEDTRKLERVGGINMLTSLAAKTVTSVNVDKYAGVVIEKWRRRKLIELGRKLIDLGFDQHTTWDDTRIKAEELVSEALSTESAKGLLKLSDIIPDLHEQLFNQRTDAIPTDLYQLDDVFNGGFRPKELVVIAGRAAMGKSFVGNFIAETIAKVGKPVAIFSAEMDNFALAKRFLCSLSKIELSKLFSQKLNDKEVDSLFDGFQALTDLPIYSDDTAGSKITIPYLFSQCSRLKREHGELGAVIVDYLQLLGDRTSPNRAGDIGKFSAALKDLSKQLDTRVIALAQINREVEGMKDKRPTMSHIKDSGSIEQDADVVITLYREEYYDPNTVDQGVLELNVVKNRNGSTGIVKVQFDPQFGQITNLKQSTF